MADTTLLHDMRAARVTVRELKSRAGAVNYAAESALHRAELALSTAIDDLVDQARAK